MKSKLFSLVLALLFVFLVACGGVQGDEPAAGDDPDAPVSSDDPTTEPETIDEMEGDLLIGEAAVENIQINIMESFPVQVSVSVSGYLGDGCTELGDITTTREENTFFVAITTKRPADAICTQQLVGFDENISLDVQGLPAGEYTVDVNGVTGTFTLDMDNTLPDSETSSPDPSGETAQLQALAGEEAILILEPGPGSRAVNTVRVAGEADPVFEQSLAVRLITADGAEIAEVPAQIAAELGQRGPFEVEVNFDVAEEQQAFIQVYAASARDGGITHLSSVGLTIAPSGEANIVPVTPQPERIAIFRPALNDTVSGGVARVEGFALASFEQTLVIEVLDEAGNVVGMKPVIVDAPDLGQPGPFEADVSYTVSAAGAGRIVVRDPSPAFGGDNHLASVEINLAP